MRYLRFFAGFRFVVFFAAFFAVFFAGDLLATLRFAAFFAGDFLATFLFFAAISLKN